MVAVSVLIIEASGNVGCNLLQNVGDYCCITRHVETMLNRPGENFLCRGKNYWVDFPAMPINGIKPKESWGTVARHCGFVQSLPVVASSFCGSLCDWTKTVLRVLTTAGAPQTVTSAFVAMEP